MIFELKLLIFDEQDTINIAMKLFLVIVKTSVDIRTLEVVVRQRYINLTYHFILVECRHQHLYEVSIWTPRCESLQPEIIFKLCENSFV